MSEEDQHSLPEDEEEDEEESPEEETPAAAEEEPPAEEAPAEEEAEADEGEGEEEGGEAAPTEPPPEGEGGETRASAKPSVSRASSAAATDGAETEAGEEGGKKVSINEEEGADDDADGDDEGEKEPGSKEGRQSTADPGKDAKKKKHSISAHLQAEVAKQKILKAKQDRENRRASLDAQHLFLIETVSTHLDLKAKDVEEFVVDSAEFLSIMDSFFEKKGKKSILFCYQDADPPGPESGRPGAPQGGKKEKMKRVMITAGNDIPMRGICMYFMRLHNENKVNVKTIADEIYFGVLDIRDPDMPGVVLESVHYLLRDVYFKVLKNNTTWINIPDPELASKIRMRFLISIEHYTDFLQDSCHDISSRLDLKEISDMEEVFEAHLRTPEDVLEASKNPEVIAKVEHTVIQWCKNFEKVLAMSKQMRKETDTMGPTAELAYWRNLMAKMCYIMQEVGHMTVQNFILVLHHSKSRVLKRWKDVDTRVTDEFHEAKDNVRYMYALEKFCAPLYQMDPPAMIEHINSMMYVIRTIHTTSRYYNTCEKVTALMVKISNQMIAACRRYITKDDTLTVWNQDNKTMLGKLNKCIELYEVYRGAYEATKAELADNADGKRFNLSVNNIFGRFEQFCERLKKIIQIVQIFDLYNPVHLSHIDGLEEISQKLKTLNEDILNKTYDPLEFRKPDFDNDFVEIRGKIDDIQEILEKFMDQAIEACPTCMHGLVLLDRFRFLRNPCMDIDGKSWYLFQFYHNEIELLHQIYEGEKNDTPIPRGYPPFAGKIAWARHLYKRLERPMKWFEEKTTILKRDEARPTIKLFNVTCKKLVYYELLMHQSWVKQCSSIYDALEAPILTLRGTMRQELVLNFDPFFRQIIDETEIIRKLGLDVPEIALIVYYKQDQIFHTYERIKGLLERFLLTKQKVPQDLSVLMRPLLKKVEKSFMPGVTNVNWTSLKAEEYFDYIEIHQADLEDIIKKTQEIMNLRINQFLFDISHTLMIDFPEDRPMTVYEYMAVIQKYGVVVARELEYKSRMCEQAVIELINMLLRTCDMPTPVDSPTLWLNANRPIPNFREGEIIVEKPPVDPAIQMTPMTKEEQLHIYEECRNVFTFYNQKVIEALQKTTRISLDILRQRTEEPQVSKRNPGKILNRVPLFTTDLMLTIPTIQVKPQLNDIQQILNRSITLITECLKRVVIWGQNRRTSFEKNATEAYYKEKTEDAQVVPYQRLQPADHLLHTQIPLADPNSRLKNSFKPVMDYKDISKMVLMMQTVVLQTKQTVQNIITQYGQYSFLWKETRDKEIKEILDTDPVITEVEAIMRSYRELEHEIESIAPSHRVGPLEVLTTEMKMGFMMEVKEWKNSLCRQMSEKYRVKAMEIAKFLDEANKDLNTPLKDMNDIRFVMHALDNIRAKQVDIDMGIVPVEECYAFLNREKYKVPEEDNARVEALRVNFKTLLLRALDIQSHIWGIQDNNKKKLMEAIAKFKTDLANYYTKYVKSGPMVEGLGAQTASDRLVIFQDEFDELWERYTMFNAAEKLFGIVPTEYPDLMKLHQELSLLQKLYGLYNDVMRSVNGYLEIKWVDLKVPKINAEIQEFQNRCRRLPKALKGWPAYEALKKKIEDFSATCPLLELMTNRAMRDRHWEKIGDIVDVIFQVESESFALKHVMEAPLLQFKDEVEDVCIGAQEEREMELTLKQLQLDWTTVPISFGHFKNRGELLLREAETSDVMEQLKKSITILEEMLANKYHGYYKKELQTRLADYQKTLKILEEWLLVQNLWVEMEAVFVGGDVARNIPLEAKRFNNSNRTWVKIMQRARENPFVLSCCISDEFMSNTLPHLREQLEMCEKAVNEFLEQQAILQAEQAAKEADKEEDYDWF